MPSEIEEVRDHQVSITLTDESIVKITQAQLYLRRLNGGDYMPSNGQTIDWILLGFNLDEVKKIIETATINEE